jgi:hypothetical protein
MDRPGPWTGCGGDFPLKYADIISVAKVVYFLIALNLRFNAIKYVPGLSRQQTRKG